MRKTGKQVISVLTGLLLVATMLFSCLACASAGKEIKNIEITTPPTKTDYVKGEKFDPTGMVVSVNFKEEGAKAEVLKSGDYTLSPSVDEALDTTDRAITVTYEKDGKKYNAKQSITVHNKATAVTIKTQPTKLEYTVGEKFDPTGMVVNVTYEDGSSKEVEITASNARYKLDPLTDDDAEFIINYGGIDVKVTLTISTGVFIEAESAVIKAKSYQVNSDSPKASGGQYIGNMFAGDSITFKFVAESAGKADIAFILSSVYLKRGTGDGGWTPVEMGDCQFNKIVEFTVNGTKYNIPDTAVLPGGIAEDEATGDQSLWFNWKEVVFEDIDLKAGSNAITLTFIKHDYVSSQNDWTGNFGANIDCLRVDTDVKCSQQPYDITVTDSEVAKSGDNVMLTITGTAHGYEKSQIFVAFSGTNYPVDEYTLDEAKATYTAKLNLASVNAGDYTNIALVAGQDNVPVKTTHDGGSFSDSVSNYTVAKTDAGLLTIKVEGGSMYKATKVELKVVDGKPCYVITGNVAGYTAEQFSLDMQENGTWGMNSPEYTMDIDTAAKTFTVTVDLSSLATSDNVYMPHLKLITETAQGAGDIKVENGVEATIGQSITVGGRIYTLNDSAFNCVCVKIVPTTNYQTTGFDLENKNNKPYLVVKGSYAGYTSTEVKEEITKQLYADLTGSPEFSQPGSLGNGYPITHLTLDDTMTIEVSEEGTYKIYLDLSSMTQNGFAVFLHFSYTGNSGNNLSMAGFTLDYEKSITVGTLTFKFIDTRNAPTDWTRNLVAVIVTEAGA